MPTFRTRGIIIKKTDVGEADRIFTILTNDRGKVRVIARGVRKGRAKLAGYLDLLRCNDFELAEGRNLDIVTGAVTVANFGDDASDLNAFGVKLYLLELVEKLIEEQAPAHGIFELLFESLLAIRNKALPLLLAKTYFEMKLLSLLGLTPQIDHSVATRKNLSDKERVFFSSHLGGLVGDGEAAEDPSLISISLNAVKLMRALSTWPLEDVARLKVGSAVMQEAESVMADYTRYSLEYRSKTLRVMGELGGGTI